MKIDPNYRAEHVLASGVHVTIRLLEARDRDELRRRYARLSPDSRYLRFLAIGPTLSEELLDRLLDVDGRDRLALVAVTDSNDLKTERGLGIARFFRLEDPKVAEAAVTVSDEAQG